MIEVDNLVKRYNTFTAVDRVIFHLGQGELFGLLGPNGAGKTTSILMMCGLLKPDAGEVFVNGEKMDSRSRMQRRVGICPQQIVLWNSLTCLEQLVFVGEMYDIPAKTAHTRAKQLLEDMALSDKSNCQAKTLSGGMQRRLNLIMALVHDPDIIVLDEPEAGLDPQSRVLVRDFIRSLARIKTVILTTHNMDEADRMVDRVAIIDHGQLLALDTPFTLKEKLGEGDVLEFSIVETCNIPEVQKYLKNQFTEVNVSGNMFTLRGHGLVDLLPMILATLERLGCKAGDIRLRQNTLEDVFLALTGRRLRE